MFSTQDALEYHARGRPGKIAVVPTKPLTNQRDLSLAYSPGVAEPCLAIQQNPEAADRYTAKRNLVAVVTNGTAVLGLGNIGALASKPVMEGKANLFKRFADIDVFDLEVGSEDPEDVIRFCQLLEPTVGGINLEDIRAPACFQIEQALRRSLKIPVFHDDQHGTAIIVGAALLNAVELVDKAIEDVRVVFCGAGAAAVATAEHLVRLGVAREHVVLCDRKGVVTRDRSEGMDPYKARFATTPGARTIADALVGADVFIGLSAADAIAPASLRAMARDPIIFALANPVPEIMPDEAREIRPDAVLATGRSDFPNQVNNVLGFPSIFRGALDARATAINEEMKMAATRALAGLAREEVPDAVARLYGVPDMHFGRSYLIPVPFDPRILITVAPAVAWAAVASGAASGVIDVDEYRDRLRARFDRAQGIMHGLVQRARREPKRVVFPEGTNHTILRAARAVAEDGIAHPILLGSLASVEREAAAAGVVLDGIDVQDPATSPQRATLAHALWTRRQRKGLSLAEATHRLYNANYFGALLVATGYADALVSGATLHYPETLRPALEAVGPQEGVDIVSGMYILAFDQQVVFCADTTVNIDPSAAQLAQIALTTARAVRSFGIEPRIAMLSFSNFGSVRHPTASRVAEAVAVVRRTDSTLMIDGELQADTALDEEKLRAMYPFSALREPANVLIFPDLNAGNIGYKLLHRLGGATAIGPILLGMAKPVHILEAGADVGDIVNMTAIAVVDAQERTAAGGGAP